MHVPISAYALHCMQAPICSLSECVDTWKRCVASKNPSMAGQALKPVINALLAHTMQEECARFPVALDCKRINAIETERTVEVMDGAIETALKRLQEEEADESDVVEEKADAKPAPDGGDIVKLLINLHIAEVFVFETDDSGKFTFYDKQYIRNPQEVRFAHFCAYGYHCNESRLLFSETPHCFVFCRDLAVAF